MLSPESKMYSTFEGSWGILKNNASERIYCALWLTLYPCHRFQVALIGFEADDGAVNGIQVLPLNHNFWPPAIQRKSEEWLPFHNVRESKTISCFDWRLVFSLSHWPTCQSYSQAEQLWSLGFLCSKTPLWWGQETCRWTHSEGRPSPRRCVGIDRWWKTHCL